MGGGWKGFLSRKTRTKKKGPSLEDLDKNLSPWIAASGVSPAASCGSPLSPAANAAPTWTINCGAAAVTGIFGGDESGDIGRVRDIVERQRPPEPGEAMEELGGGSSPGCHQRGCKAVPEAELPEDLPEPLLMSLQQTSRPSTPSDSGCELEENEVCSIHGVGKKFQKEPAATGPHLPAVPEASWHQQGAATCERAVSADVENGFCTSDGSVREPLAPQGQSAATNNEHKRNLRRSLGERFRRHPVGTVVLILLVVLVLALVVALAVQPAAPQVPVTSATPLSLLGCPRGWVGNNRVCYSLSRDYRTWEQGQERCSELNASLAIAKDEEAMDLLFHLRRNGGFWLGLRRRGERLHWGDGSSYSSWVPVLGNSQCVYLADETFRSDNCSNERPYLCSKAQAPL